MSILELLKVQFDLMENNLTFHRSILSTTQSKVDATVWDTVMDEYDKKEYVNVIRGIINYVDPGLTARSANEDKTKYSAPHGSVVIDLEITDSHLKVRAPFLKVEGAKKVPLMRQVAQLNFSPLNLADIVLENNQLEFRYDCPLELCEPYKTYNALREICIYADSYDDEFIKKFGAQWIQEPKVTRHSKEIEEEVWANVQLYIKEALDGISHFESKRIHGFVWDLIVITLMKIEYYASPQGNLRTEIEKNIGYMNNQQNTIHDKIDHGKRFLKKLQDYNKEHFLSDLYIAETFIPYKWRSTHDNIKSNFENAYAQAGKEFKGNDHTGASLTLMYNFFNMFYNNNVPDNVADIVTNGMQKGSNKPWHDASTAMFASMEQIMTGKKLASKPKKKKGFFSKLFGNG